jgi:N-acetylmuramoyl-L-alanine amidase
MKIKALKRLICGLPVLVLCFSLLSFKSQASTKKDTVVNTGFKVKTIIVDAGHGGKPSGTQGHFSHGASGSYSSERSVTLAVALKLQTAIEKDLSDVKVVLTRNTEDDVAWERRADIANENKGNVFISIHCNSLADRRIRERVGTKHHKAVYRTIDVPDRSGKGVLILVYGFHRSKEEENAIKHNQIEEDVEMNSAADPNDPTTAILINEYKRKFRQQSINLANIINTQFVDTDGRPSEGIREQGVYVLCHSAMPSVLVEIGYINNPDDEAYLNSEKGQDEIVASLVRALKTYKDEVEQVSK